MELLKKEVLELDSDQRKIFTIHAKNLRVDILPANRTEYINTRVNSVAVRCALQQMVTHELYGVLDLGELSAEKVAPIVD